MGENIISISGLVVEYGGQKALDLEMLEFEQNRVHVLVGPNGSGKTTLLRVIAGIEKPLSGKVTILGKDLYGASRREFQNTIREVSLCFQKPYLFNSTVRRNIEYGLRFRDISQTERQSRFENAVNSLGLQDFLERNAQSLSAGETQRVSIARMIALKPKIALLDEPVANVDASNKSRVEAAITSLHENGSTVIVATHHIEQAYHLSANVVRLENGRIAPPALENLLEGEIRRENGDLVLSVDGIKLSVISGRPGLTRASIDPKSIIVSTSKIQSSARNCLKGKVIKLSEQNGTISLTVDAGIPLTARITAESYKNLGINIGSEVYLTFKASTVMVF